MNILESNVILTNDKQINVNENLFNTLIIGGPGYGKTQSFVKPNILQMDKSYVVIDINGAMFKETADILKDNGYIIKVVNFRNTQYSHRYNPFKYFYNNSDIINFAENMIENTNNSSNKDLFWIESEKNLLLSLLYYINYNYEKYPEKKNIGELIKILFNAIQNNNELEFLDKLFENIPDNQIEKSFYNRFKNSNNENIVKSLFERFSYFVSDNFKKLNQFTKTDEIELENLNKQKQILYIIIDPFNLKYQGLQNALISQIFKTIKYETIKNKNNQLNTVHFLFDEFSNIGKQEDFIENLKNSNNYNIIISIITQSLHQIENMYEKEIHEIMSCCQFILYFGNSFQYNVELTTISEYIKNTGTKKSLCKDIDSIIKKEIFRNIPLSQCVLIEKDKEVNLYTKYFAENHPNYKKNDTNIENYFNGKVNFYYDNEEEDDLKNNKNIKFTNLPKISQEKAEVETLEPKNGNILTNKEKLLLDEFIKLIDTKNNKNEIIELAVKELRKRKI